MIDDFDAHWLQENECRSWRCRRLDTSALFFTVTWTAPGHLSLAGAFGEFTISNYQGMPTWQAAVHWLRQADFDTLGRPSFAITAAQFLALRWWAARTAATMNAYDETIAARSRSSVKQALQGAGLEALDDVDGDDHVG